MRVESIGFKPRNPFKWQSLLLVTRRASLAQKLINEEAVDITPGYEDLQLHPSAEEQYRPTAEKASVKQRKEPDSERE